MQFVQYRLQVEEEIVPPEIQTLIKQPFFSKTFNINYTTRNN